MTNPVGYSGTPLAKKLGIVENVNVVTKWAPQNYAELLEPIPPGVKFQKRVSKTSDVIRLKLVIRKELR